MAQALIEAYGQSCRTSLSLDLDIIALPDGHQPSVIGMQVGRRPWSQRR
jgi:hypothetical protein